MPHIAPQARGESVIPFTLKNSLGDDEANYCIPGWAYFNDGDSIYLDTQALFLPIVVPEALRIDALSFYSYSTGSITARMAIYRRKSDGMPGALVIDADTIEVTTKSFYDASFSEIVLQPGQYFIAIVSDGGLSIDSLYRYNITTPVMAQYRVSGGDTLGNAASCVQHIALKGDEAGYREALMIELGDLHVQWLHLVKAAGFSESDVLAMADAREAEKAERGRKEQDGRIRHGEAMAAVKRWS